MRISVDKSDKGYSTYVRNAYMRDLDIRVFLNDVEQRDVVTADDALGFVLKAKRDKSGLLVKGDDEFSTEQVFGNVRIEIGGRAP